MRLLAYALLAVTPLAVQAQEANPTQNVASSDRQPANPIFRVQVVSRSIPAMSYRNRSGWTKIDFQGTSLASKAKGTAEVNSGLGNTQIKVDVKDLPAPTTFGSEFLTYVLWAITPDGHASNIGEVVVDDHGDYKGTTTTNLQAFGLIVTAEPYWDVAMPSDVVVMQNIARTDTKGKQEVINASYELLPRGQYLYQVPSSQQHPVDLSSKKNPLEIYEAENAVQIARYAKSDRYASDVFQNAVSLLNQAEDYQARKQWKPAIMTAKEAVEKAEDARVISLRKQQQEALANERQAAAEREAAARAHAEQEAAAAQQAAQQQQLAEAQARREAEARSQAEKAREEADAARAQAATEAQRAQAAAAEADRLRQQAEASKEQLRQQLLQQFNTILQTTETPRGLVINMSDVLFDVNKYSLKEPAREKLARLSGIILSHPGLNLRVEGYTDSTGSDQYNLKLSQERADSVKAYLINQGLSPDTITSVGYGEAYPVADNNTSSGRAQNRRVQIVVSGEVIGVQIGQAPGASTSNAPAPNQPGTMQPGTNPPAPRTPPPPQP